MRARLDVHSDDVYCPACRSEYPEGWKRCPTDEAQLLRGPTVGKYKIDRVIGQGGMGAVYRAENPDTRAEVAVKLLHGGSAGVEQARTRFQREAAAVAALRTRHVVSIFDFGSDVDGTLYLVMELLQGHTLRREIARPPDAMPPGRIDLVIDGMLRGLGAAHRAGIVHRDLKPENVFLARTDDGEVAKLLDFGVARTTAATTLTQSGALMGTPAYMAPEQIAGNRGDIGPWTDVYAVGVILYELFAGVAPFAADSMTEILSKVLSRELAPLRSVRAGLPEAVYQLTERALADAASERYADADALREAWAAAYATFPTEVRTAPVPRFAGDRGGDDLASAPTAAATAAGTPGPERRRERAAMASQDRAAAEHPSTRLPPRRGLLLAAGGVIAALVSVVIMLVRGKGDGARTAAVVDAAIAIDAGVVTPIDAGPPPGMVALPGGTFTMGSSPDLVKAYPSAVAAQTTEVAGFLLDRTEMTAIALASALGRPPGPSDLPDLPARGVTWTDARTACAALGKRLPTEAEWEFAARRSPLAAEHAVLRRPGVDGPAAVGSHAGDCTTDGVCDLLGNVMEWTSDGTPAARIARGASFGVSIRDPWYATVAARAAVAPDRVDPELGVRCAADRPGSGR